MKLLATVLLLLLLTGASGPPPFLEDDDDGNASSGLPTRPPHSGVQAAFALRGYAPGSTAELVLRGSAPAVVVGLFHAGAGHEGPLEGSPVAAQLLVPFPGRSLKLSVGGWPSGLYYARVTTPGVGDWYAPFVLRARRPGTARILVVLPTNTWQAYNYEDGGSWYEHASVRRVDVTRPFIDAGVPPHYHGYDRGFLRWLALHGEQPDFLADDDLDRVTGADLARAYDLVVFPGHEEYVTKRAYDAVTGFRNRGGNLAFLAANNLFWHVVRHGKTIQRVNRWRDAGRPESAVAGVQYRDWNHGRYPTVPYVVQGVEHAPWLFAGTGLENGDTFGSYGIEVDMRTPASPPGTHVLARVDDIFGNGIDAEMTYYETPRGAKVFSAGVMNFGGSALWPVITTMMENLWAELREP